MTRPSTYLRPAGNQAPAGAEALSHDVDRGRTRATGQGEAQVPRGRGSRTLPLEGAAGLAAGSWRSLA